MVAGADELARSMQLPTAATIEAVTKLAIALVERRAERLRQAAREGERRAQRERARLAAHRAADAAIWQRTARPEFWRSATPEQIARAWRAVSTWHQVDPDAAGARQAIAQRLRRRGVDVSLDVSANPGDARWLQTALALAQAEREQLAAYSADLDTDGAEMVGQVMWADDELPSEPLAAEAAATSAQPSTAPSPRHETFPDQRAEPTTVQPGQFGKGTSDAADDTAVRTRSDRELKRMEAILRQALPGHKADRIVADAAWPVLARSMYRLDRDGKDVAALLKALPYDTTDAKVPAVLTDWTLRQMAAGPLQMRRAEQRRQAHVQRTEHAKAQLAGDGAHIGGQEQAAPRPVAGVDQESVARVRAAFPISTRQAINSPVLADVGGGRGQAAAVGRGQERTDAVRD